MGSAYSIYYISTYCNKENVQCEYKGLVPFTPVNLSDLSSS